MHNGSPTEPSEQFLLNMCSYIVNMHTHPKACSTHVYPLLPGNSQELYNILFDEVLNLISDVTIPNPSLVMTDFEKQQLMHPLHFHGNNSH